MLYGRTDELDALRKIVEDDQVRCVLVVGQPGLGKTTLLAQLDRDLSSHNEFKVGVVRLEPVQTDTADAVLALFMDQAREARSYAEGSFDLTPQRKEQWRALLNVINIGDLVMSLHRDPHRSTREQFAELMLKISKRLKESERLVLILDPKKYVSSDSAYAWADVVSKLPQKCVLVIAQRPDDSIAQSEAFVQLIVEGLCRRVPTPELEKLSSEAVCEYVQQWRSGDGAEFDWNDSADELISSLDGHPYALEAVLNLLADGFSVEDIPLDPTPTALFERQWDRALQSGDAESRIKIFEAMAAIGIELGHEEYARIAGVPSDRIRILLANPFTKTLIAQSPSGIQLYHEVFRNFVEQKASVDALKGYRIRAIELFHERLEESHLGKRPPDLLAAMELPSQLRKLGRNTYAKAVIASDVARTLSDLGQYEELESILRAELEDVDRNSPEAVMLKGALGSVMVSTGRTHDGLPLLQQAINHAETQKNPKAMASFLGEIGRAFHEAEDYVQACIAFDLSVKLASSAGYEEAMATNYTNLGNSWFKRRAYSVAKGFFEKAMEIDKKLNNKVGEANNIGNLANVLAAEEKLDDALDAMTQAQQILVEIGHPVAQARLEGNIGLVLWRKGRMDEAQDKWEAAASKLRNFGHVSEAETLERLLGTAEAVGQDE